MEDEKVDTKRTVAQQQKIELLEKKLVTSVSECSRLASRVEELGALLYEAALLVRAGGTRGECETFLRKSDKLLAGAHAEEKE